jgi:hypothetical protein
MDVRVEREREPDINVGEQHLRRPGFQRFADWLNAQFLARPCAPAAVGFAAFPRWASVAQRRRKQQQRRLLVRRRRLPELPHRFGHVRGLSCSIFLTRAAAKSSLIGFGIANGPRGCHAPPEISPRNSNRMAITMRMSNVPTIPLVRPPSAYLQDHLRALEAIFFLSNHEWTQGLQCNRRSSVSIFDGALCDCIAARRSRHNDHCSTHCRKH